MRKPQVAVFRRNSANDRAVAGRPRVLSLPRVDNMAHQSLPKPPDLGSRPPKHHLCMPPPHQEQRAIARAAVAFTIAVFFYCPLYRAFCPPHSLSWTVSTLSENGQQLHSDPPSPAFDKSIPRRSFGQYNMSLRIPSPEVDITNLPSSHAYYLLEHDGLDAPGFWVKLSVRRSDVTLTSHQAEWDARFSKFRTTSPEMGRILSRLFPTTDWLDCLSRLTHYMALAFAASLSGAQKSGVHLRKAKDRVSVPGRQLLACFSPTVY